MNFKIITLPEAGSTNTEAARLASLHGGNLAVVATAQTAGRGQRGNVWESAPGENLTVSLLINHPEGLEVKSQFRFSEAMALAVADTVEQCGGGEATVKWPNDVYADGDGKVSGLLIENSVSGSGMVRSIVGIGLNVNQLEWHGDAPNPISIRQISGKQQPVEAVLETLLSNVERRYAAMATHAQHEEYRRRQWWGCGFHPYRIPAEGDAIIEAEIADIAPDGMLTLRRRNGQTSSHAFKEALAVTPRRR